MRNPYSGMTEESKRRCNIGTCTRCGKEAPIGVEELNGVAVRLCEDCGCKVFRELARANGRGKVAKPRKATAKPTHKPAASPTIVQAPVPATAPATLPTNTVDWARDARRRGWAVLHGMPQQQLRAYQTRVEYLVSYPAATAELARIESSRYWLNINVSKAM